jgi:tRNA A37 N6-isopentenylltransferase MiaA
MQHIAEPFAGGRFRERFLNTVTALLKSALPPILIGGIVGYFGGLFKIKNEISDLRKGMFNKIEKRDEQHFNATLDWQEPPTTNRPRNARGSILFPSLFLSIFHHISINFCGRAQYIYARMFVVP